MQYITIAVLLYASYTDIVSLEAEPVLITLCMAGRILEMVIKGQMIAEGIVAAGLVFLVLLAGCVFFSLGGADALIGALICLNLGSLGIYAVMTAFVFSVPFILVRNGKETPMIPFLTIGYLLWLFF